MNQSLTPRQIRSLENIDRLVKTAIEMFREDGYDAVTIDDVCARCGLSKGVFYYRFHSKEDLVSYAHKLFCDCYIESRVVYDEVVPLRDQLRDYLWAQFCFSVSFGKTLIARGLQGLIGATDQMRRGADPRVKDGGQEESTYSGRLELLLVERGVRSGAFRGDPTAEDAAGILRSFVLGSRMLWLMHTPVEGEEESAPLTRGRVESFLTLLLKDED